MVRSLYNPKTGRLRDFPLSTKDGGTGANNGPDALTNLNAVPANKKDVANGIAILGADLKVKPENIPSGIVTGPTVMGPLETYEGQPSTHVITNYDILNTYTVTAVTGTVSVVKDTITYTAPLSVGSGGFYVNGKLFSINVKATVLRTPVVTAPVNGATNRPSLITVSVSSGGYTGYAGDLKSGSWQLATDSGFTNIVQESLNDTVNLYVWLISGLVKNTTYWVRYRWTESYNNLVSDWSDPVSFTTRNTFYPGDEQVKLLANDPGQTDCLGWRVSISLDGNYVAVSASQKAGYTGAVYVYVKSGSSWVFQAKLVGSAAVAGTYFGWSVSINQDGSMISAGCYSNTDGVYVFTRSGVVWSEEARILPPPVGDGVTILGHAIALSYDGKLLTIGCFNKTVTNVSQGIIYFYGRNSSAKTWSLLTSYSNPSGLANDMLGCSVSYLSKSYNLVAGSFGKIGTANDGGVLVRILTASTVNASGDIASFTILSAGYFQVTTIGNRERYACEVSGYMESPTKMYAIVGNYTALDGLNKVRGLVTLIDLYTGSIVQIFRPNEIMEGGRFGRSVSMSCTGTVFAVGTEFQTDTLSGQGSAYFYALEEGLYSQKALVHPADTAAGDHFGISVCLSNDAEVAVIGASNKNGTFTIQGAAYMYA
jgi:hypothetical protein